MPVTYTIGVDPTGRPIVDTVPAVVSETGKLTLYCNSAPIQLTSFEVTAVDSNKKAVVVTKVPNPVDLEPNAKRIGSYTFAGMGKITVTLKPTFDDKLYSADSTIFKVELGTAPILDSLSSAKISISPIAQASCTLSVTAGTGLSYKWSKGGVPLPDTSASLIIKSVTKADDGVYTCEITNKWGTVTSGTRTLTVVENQAPVWNVTPLTVKEGTLIQLDLTTLCSDDNKDPLEFTLAPTSTILASIKNSTLTYQTTFTDAGAHSLTIVASDKKVTTLVTIPVTITNVNRVPVLKPSVVTTLPSVKVNVPFSFKYDTIATDPDGEDLKYTLLEKPAALIEAPAGTLTFTPTISNVGKFSFTVKFTDGIDPVVQKFECEVLSADNHAPTWNVSVSKGITIPENGTLELKLDTMATDPDGDLVTVAIAEQLPTWMTYSATGVLTLKPGYKDASATPYTITITATDPKGLKSLPQKLSISVIDANIGAVSGIVTNSVKTPIAGVIVATVPGGLADTTDANGAYMISGLILGQVYDFTYTGTGYEPLTKQRTASETTPIVSGDLVLSEIKGSISGTVKDTAGALLAGIQVTVVVGGNTYTTNTSTVGTYLLNNLPHGQANVTFTSPDYASFISSCTISTVKKDQTVDAVLKVSTGKFTGVVTDIAGKPLEKVQVSTGKYSTFTKADGSYELAVGALATYSLTFTKTNYQVQSVPSLTLSSAKPAAVQDVKLAAKTGTISGIVKNSANVLLSGVLVTALPGGLTATTDANGAYSFAGVTLDQLYSMTFSITGYQNSSVPAQVTEAAPAATLTPLILKEIPGTITGTVKDALGAVQAGVAVTVVVGDSTYSSNTATDGTYTVAGIAHGTATITFTKSTFAAITKQVIVSLAKKEHEVDAVILKSPGKISGIVTDVNNLPLIGVTVSDSKNSVVTNDKGEYTFAVGELTTYTLTFSKTNYVAQTSAPIVLTDGTPNTIQNMKLTAKTGTLSGVVKNGTNTPIAGVTVTTTPGGFSTTTDANGAYSIATLQQGIEYQISWTKAGYVVLSNKVTVDEAVPAQVVNPVLVEQKGTLTGLVFDTENAVASGATVKIQGAGGTADAIVGADGKFKIEALTPGNYLMSVVGGTAFVDTTLKDSVTVTMASEKDLGVIKVIRKNNFSRSILGSFAVHKDTVDSVVAEFRDVNVSTWSSVKCTYDISFGYSGILKVNDVGTNWVVRVKTYAKGHKIGQSSIAQFTKSSGDITFTSSFSDPTNAIPTVTVAAPTTVNINTDVSFTANAIDSLGGSVVSYEWEFGDGSTATGKSVTHKYLSEKSFPVKVKVTDDDGNTAINSAGISIVNPNTVITGLNTGMKATIGDEKTFAITAVDENGIKKIIWYKDGVLISEGVEMTIKNILSTTAKKVVVEVKVIDNFDDTTSASTTIDVTNEKPILSVGTFPASVKAGETVTIPFTATDDGQMSYSFAHGTGEFTKCDSGKISFVAPNILDADYPVKVRVTDEDGYITDTTVTVGVNVWAKDELSGQNGTAQQGMARLSDGSYVVIGNAAGKFQINKYDSNGDPVWKKDLTGESISIYGEYVIPYGAGGFIVAGSSYKAWICAFNSNGDKLFETKSTLPSLERMQILHISPTSDGGFITCGSWFNPSIPTECLYTLKISSTGAIEWEKKWPDQEGSAIFQNADGTYSLFCSDGSLITLDKDGKQVGGVAQYLSMGSSCPRSFIKTSDGNYACIYGSATSMIRKITPNGSKIWEAYHEVTPYALTEMSDGSIAYVGSKSPKSQIAIAGLLTADGKDKIGMHDLISLPNSYASSIVQAQDGGFVVIGNDGTKNVIIKTDADLKTIYAK